MPRRLYIYQNDVTTAGGVVLEGHRDVAFTDRPLSYEGAQIMCISCKTIGHIRCVAPFRPNKLPNGRQVALEHDLCICKCPKPPKLVASQTSVGMEFEKFEMRALEVGEESSPTPASSTVAVEAPTICLECLAAAAAAGTSMVVRSPV